MDRLTEYDYEVYHRPCKANIIRIADGLSRMPGRYSQYAVAIDSERMALAASLADEKVNALKSRVTDQSLRQTDELLEKNSRPSNKPED